MQTQTKETWTFCGLSLYSELVPLIQTLIKSSSPISALRRYLLEDPENPCYLEMKFIFSKWVDLEDTLEDCNFSTVHHIVLRLTSIDLRAQLELSTASIDTRCALGQSPLHWAISSGNLEAMKILLDFGASLDVCGWNGGNAFSYAARRSDPTALNILLDAAYCRSPNSVQSIPTSTRALTEMVPTPRSARDPWVMALINQVTKYGSYALLYPVISDFHENVQILLNHGAFLDSPSNEYLPIFVAIAHHSHRTLEILLQRGVKTNVKDFAGQGIFHRAALLADLETIHILTDAKLCCTSTTDKDNNGRMPLAAFDEQRAAFQIEDNETRLKCREAFLNLLQSVNPTGTEHICRASIPATRFDAVMKLDEISMHTMDDKEEFFEACSNLEELFESKIDRL